MKIKDFRAFLQNTQLLVIFQKITSCQTTGLLFDKDFLLERKGALIINIKKQSRVNHIILLQYGTYKLNKDASIIIII